MMRVRTGPDLAAGGDAIATAPDGRVVFVASAAPNEVVEVEVVQDNATFLRARALRVLEAGASRVEPPCAHYRECGGCRLQHVDEAEQTRSKEAALLETLARIGKVDASAIRLDPAWRSEASDGGRRGYRYRIRARFAVLPSGRVGFRRERSREVADVEECLVLAPPLASALAAIRRSVKTSGVGAKRAEEIDAVASEDCALLRIPPGLDHLRRALSEVKGVRVASSEGESLEVEDEHGRLFLSPDVFTQSNALGTSAMVRHVIDLLAGYPACDLVELYAGSGTFTRALIRVARRVRTYESSRIAVSLARRMLGDRVAVGEEDVEDALRRLLARGERIDAIVMNPPRAGAAPEVVRLLGALSPNVVIYVSCDPATLARDLERLSRHRLALDRVRLFDLYPQTAHVEVIGRMVRERTT